MNPARRRTTATAATAVVLATAGGLLTTVTTPASAATTCTSPVFKRQFFANTTFSGTPKKTDCDSTVNENWGTGAPASGLPSNNFSVRWTLTRDFGSGGPFAFTVSTQDGIRVYLDGTRKVDIWKNVSTTQKKTVNATIPSGKHTLRVDYVNWTGTANVSFSYAPRTSATVDKVKPLTPTGASVSYDRTTGKAKVVWAKNNEMDLAGYRVHRRLKGSSYPGKPLATTTSTTYTDTPPPTGETYYYEVRAYDKAGNESAGTADLPVVTPDLTGPAAPSGLSAHGDLYGMVIAWNPVPDAAGYELYERDPATGTNTRLEKLTGTSYTHYMGQSATQHTYVVRAYDAAGNAGAYSAPVTSDSLDRTPPAPPHGLRAVPDRAEVALYWYAPQDPTSDELDSGAHFAVLRSKGGTLGADSVKVACKDPDQGSGIGADVEYICKDLDWEPDTTYTYGVTFTDGSGNVSKASDTVTVTTADFTAPRPLTGLTATPRADGVALRWDRPVDDDVVSYRVLAGKRRADGTVDWLAGPMCDDAPDDPLAALCPDVPNGETYVFTVIARDKWGNSMSANDPSAPQVTATELTIAPGEPIGADQGPLYGSGGWHRGSEDIAPTLWDCRGDTCGDIKEFRVSRWNPATETYDFLATVPAEKPESEYYFSYLDPTQPLGTISYYRVVGVRADGSETAPAHPYRIRPDLL
ncbi:fibronectin type III domain-containing protein [Streptomyces sp. NPDC093984]|uniref:fibronectin type III domain-containing protein n=1 Tax=Streptomyces sp. NPDC093984 TaxID=3366052 RepID=UPI003820C64D